MSYMKRRKEAETDAMCVYLRELYQEDQGLIRFFVSGTPPIYVVHGEWARVVAQDYFFTLACIKMIGKRKPLETVELKQEKFEEVLRDLLLNKKRRVALYSKRGTSKWHIIRQASPGNVRDFEEILWRHKSLEGSPQSLAVCFGTGKSGQQIVGVASGDTTGRTLRYAEFIDNAYLSNLESVIIQTGVSECLVAKATAQTTFVMKKLKDLLKKCDVMMTEVPSSNFKAANLNQDLPRLISTDTNAEDLYSLKLACKSVACVIQFLELLSNTEDFSQYQLSRIDLTSHMRLDQPAFRALNLLPAPNDANKTFNLFGLLNHCRTAMGTRCLLEWIKQPLLDIGKIEKRLNFVECMMSDPFMKDELQIQFRRIPDLMRLTKKFMKQKPTATLKDCVVLYDMVSRLPAIYDQLVDYNGPHLKLLSKTYTSTLNEIIRDFGGFAELIEGTVDLEAAKSHEYLINAQLDEEFTKLVESRAAIQKAMDMLYAQACMDLHDGKKNRTKPYATMTRSKKDKTWCFECPRRFKGRARKKKYTIIEEAGMKMRVTTGRFSRLGASFSRVDDRINEKQSALVAEIIDVVKTYTPLVEDLEIIIAELDVFASFATTSAEAPRPYCRPTFLPMGSGSIVLEDARHPCLEAQEDVEFISNSVNLVKGESSFQIITGPNMGGKSTYIRQAGVIVLMAQIGCYVPCTKAQVTIVDCILARLGASDSQLRGISTFMQEMQESAAILKNATPNSLIIIDELGRGTSTYDGFGLAWAISEYICHTIGSFCFFATHFHELTALEKTCEGVKNLHVTARTEGEKLVLLYNVKEGGASQSFGIAISELAGFPADVVKMAREKVESLEKQSESHKRKREQISPVKCKQPPKKKAKKSEKAKINSRPKSTR